MTHVTIMILRDIVSKIQVYRQTDRQTDRHLAQLGILEISDHFDHIDQGIGDMVWLVLFGGLRTAKLFAICRPRTVKLFAIRRTGRIPLRLEQICVLGLKRVIQKPANYLLLVGPAEIHYD